MERGTTMKTGHRPSSPRCSLARMLPSTTNPEAIKHDGWNDYRILVVQADDPRINWIERQIIEAIGARLYGRR